MKPASNRSHMRALSLLLAVALTKLGLANFHNNTPGVWQLYPSTVIDNLNREIGTSDGWYTGWTYAWWSGNQTTTEARTYHGTGGSWTLDDHQTATLRTSISTGRLHESATESQGVSKTRIHSSDYLGSVARVAVSDQWGDWPGDPWSGL